MPLGPHAGLCWHCYEWHQAALRVLGGYEPPDECPNCHASAIELKLRELDGELRFYLAGKDMYEMIYKEPLGKEKVWIMNKESKVIEGKIK